MCALYLSRFLILLAIVLGVPSLAHAQRPDELVKMAVKIVPPEYPDQARRHWISGHGIVAGEVDYTTGKVKSVRMEKATGTQILDEAALSAFARWQFRPKTIRNFRTPIVFDMAASREEAMTKARGHPGTTELRPR